jgi:hypothetical protein
VQEHDRASAVAVALDVQRARADRDAKDVGVDGRGSVAGDRVGDGRPTIDDRWA